MPMALGDVTLGLCLCVKWLSGNNEWWVAAIGSRRIGPRLAWVACLGSWFLLKAPRQYMKMFTSRLALISDVVIVASQATVTTLAVY